VRLPLAEREIPVVADEYVDRESAPAPSRSRRHTFHRLAGGQPASCALSIFNLDHTTTSTDEVPADVDRYAARRRPRHLTAAHGRLGKAHRMIVLVRRTGEVVEPMRRDQCTRRSPRLPASASARRLRRYDRNEARSSVPLFPDDDPVGRRQIGRTACAPRSDRVRVVRRRVVMWRRVERSKAPNCGAAQPAIVESCAA